MSTSQALDVDGELSIALDEGRPLRLIGRGSEITLELESLRHAGSLLRSLPRDRGGLVELLRWLPVLRRAGLEFEARVRGRRVARLASDDGSWLARRLGLRGLDLRIREIVLATLP